MKYLAIEKELNKGKKQSIESLLESEGNGFMNCICRGL